MPPRLLALPLILLAAPVAAQETRESAAAKFRAEFARSDLNKDGVLTRDEVTVRMGRWRAGQKKVDAPQVKRLTDLWFGRADANGNGKVTEAEAQRLLTAVFDRYDRNRDGKLGGEDRVAAKPKAQGR